MIIKKLSIAIAASALLASTITTVAFAATPISVSASDNDGNSPDNTLDNSLETRWSADGDGQWIEYNLGELYVVDSLNVAFFKGDERLATFEVETSIEGTDWQSVFSGEQPSNTLEQQTIELDDSEAQYVRIVGYGNTTNSWNSITEVDINTLDIIDEEVETEDLVNLALEQATSQSSTSYSGIDSRAVDGDTRGNWASGSVTHTESEYHAWWQVDLGSVDDIAFINLYNRTDSCCSARLSNFYVLISDSPFTSEDLDDSLAQAGVDSYYVDDTVLTSIVVNAERSGRYIRVQLAGTNPLSLAEVEIFGTKQQAAEGAFELPALIEAEDFAAYSDNDATNKGGEYREDEGVDIQQTGDETGEYNIGWTVDGEWLQYPIFVSEAGKYTAQVRVASPKSSGQFSIVIDGETVASQIIDSTSGWQNWQTLDVFLGELPVGNHTLTFNIDSGSFNLNWLDIVSGGSNVREAATYVGGGGHIAGALAVSCDTPEGFTVVNSLSEMIRAMSQSNVKVALTPGTYSIDESDVALFTSQELPGDLSGFTLLPVDGSNSQYDFRCANIEFDTDLWSQFGNTEVTQLRTVGNYNTISNLSIEDLGESSPKGGALGVIMDGRDNVIEGLIITSRGAQPYGLGDAYGKGAGPVLSHQKHSSILIRGLRNTFKQSTVFNYSYGHSVFMQGSEDALIDGIYVQGELRSTADMLAANNERFTAADERAAGVDFITVWGYKLPTGYWMSLQEAGIRAYNGGKTIIDGVETESRAANNVTVVNSVTRHTRTGVTLVHATGTKYIENTTSVGCEQGFSIGSGDIVNSYADADVGPVITFAYSSDSGTNADITILPTDGSKNGWGALAFIGGKNHNITLRSSESVTKTNLQVVVSGDKHSIRHLEDALQNQDQLTLANSEVNNLTNYPMLINDLANGITGQSNGDISGNTSNNNLTQN